MLALGEIRTCLLQNSSSAARTVVSELLQLSPGERVRSSERPVAYAVSPELISGVDCWMPSASGARVRGIGTVAARGVVTGGRVLQSSAYVRLERGDRSGRQLPWSHYLARPGVVETCARFNRTDVIDGFLAESVPESTLNLGAVSERVIGTVQRSPWLDHVVPFKSRRTSLRWTLTVDDNAERTGGRFTIASDSLRTFGLVLTEGELTDVLELCEDLALHDWVLSTLLRMVERDALGTVDGPRALVRLRPAVDHLLHLWMPGTRVAAALLPLWDSLERSPGFTRQWQATVTRIRDQLAVQILETLNGVLNHEYEHQGGASVRSR